MSVARVTQISSRSEVGIEDAINIGIQRARESLRGVRGAWVKSVTVEVGDEGVTAYQVIMEVTFLLED
jgi:flavin-binding protein dodecin